jgi:putative Mn2+ efflux pump MntP
MSIIEIILISVGLAMDAVAVSVSCGATITERRLPSAAKSSITFGLFQGGMPVIGWAAGLGLKDLITGVDHWIAFILLALIGLKMIYDSRRPDDCEGRCRLLTTPLLLGLAIATSIDALVVGVSFAFLNISIVLPVILIGLITAGLSFSAFFAGNGLRRLVGNKVEIAGGLILIGIGVKILIEHTMLP